MKNRTPRFVAVFLIYALFLPNSVHPVRPESFGSAVRPELVEGERPAQGRLAEGLAFTLKTLEGRESNEVEASLEEALRSGK